MYIWIFFRILLEVYDETEVLQGILGLLNNTKMVGFNIIVFLMDLKIVDKYNFVW
jgi:hypothetical protein